MLSVEGKWVLFKKKIFVVFDICLPREPVRQRTKKLRTQEDRVLGQPWATASMEGRTKSKHPLLDRQCENRLTKNAQHVKRQVLRLELEFLVYEGQDVTARRVAIGILLCVIVTSLETDALVAIVASIDMLMVRRSPAKGRKKRVLKEQFRF